MRARTKENLQAWVLIAAVLGLTGWVVRTIDRNECERRQSLGLECYSPAPATSTGAWWLGGR